MRSIGFNPEEAIEALVSEAPAEIKEEVREFITKVFGALTKSMDGHPITKEEFYSEIEPPSEEVMNFLHGVRFAIAFVPDTGEIQPLFEGGPFEVENQVIDITGQPKSN